MMKNKDRWVSLEEAAYFFSGGTPSKSNHSYWGGNIPWVSAKDMKSIRVSDTIDHITEDGLANGTRLAPAGATLVLVRGMTLLTDVPICIADREMAFNQDVKALVPRPGIFAKYLSYAVLAAKPELQSTIDLAGHGTGRLPTDVFRSIRIRLPSLDEQQKIAHILGTLDDKIELNRRMNETLGAMAKAIFKSWFVDFAPVRAKMSGEPPKSICRRLGLTPGLLELFPDRLQHYELGEIPEGWTVNSLDDIATYLNGLALQKYPVGNGDWLPVVKIAQLRAGHTAGADHASAELPSEYVVKDGDVLFSWSGSLEVEIWCGGRGALNQHLFKVTSDLYPKWFYYMWTKQHLPMFREIAADKATTMGHIQRKHLSQAKALIPGVKLLNQMTFIIQPLVEKVAQKNLESRALAKVRDALLPKLLSGELTVQVVGGV
jgi:type I restriction enzyme S subunit